MCGVEEAHGVRVKSARRTTDLSTPHLPPRTYTSRRTQLAYPGFWTTTSYVPGPPLEYKLNFSSRAGSIRAETKLPFRIDPLPPTAAGSPVAASLTSTTIGARIHCGHITVPPHADPRNAKMGTQRHQYRVSDALPETRRFVSNSTWSSPELFFTRRLGKPTA